MIATLGKVGTGFDLANEKRYDAWGAVRSGSGVGSHIVNPNTGYCANLGHKWDGESDLIYMRARYYEPSTRKFISKDSARDGANWYVYCANGPECSADFSGCDRFWINIGDWQVSFDFYYRSGTGEAMCDIHWREIGSKLVNGRGAVCIDGAIKHGGEDMPYKLKQALAGEGQAARKYRKTRTALGIGAMDSITAAFEIDPLETLAIIGMAIHGLDLVWNKEAWKT